MIVFNKPYLTGKELDYIKDAAERGQLAGDGLYTKKCSELIQNQTQSLKALITHSCTAALEMAAILADIKDGDEIIMPSYTFVSSANAFVLRGGVPVFIDINPNSMNLDETLIAQAITPKTKAILVVHYAGASCEMSQILEIAHMHNLLVIEDAAQAIFSKYDNKPLGSIGDLGCLSFHETKNIISGEGGALLINNANLLDRAEIIRQKGTNRSQFMRGKVDKYSWVDIGSSFLAGELTAAFLLAQLEHAELITSTRMTLWNKYYDAFQILEQQGICQIPRINVHSKDHNAHIFFLILKTSFQRNKFIYEMEKLGVNCVFHYVPLHSSICGSKLGRIAGTMKYTDDLSERLVRLPLSIGLDVDRVIDDALKVLAAL